MDLLLNVCCRSWESAGRLAYRSHHSTETALLRVISDIVGAVDRGRVTLLLRTFLVGRTKQVLYIGRLSFTGRLDFGVPQGSVLGPLLFLLYSAELFEVINRKGLVEHSYADDTQVHLSVPASELSVAARQFSAVLGVHWWDGQLDAVKQTQNEHRQNPADSDRNAPPAATSCQRSASMRSNCS